MRRKEFIVVLGLLLLVLVTGCGQSSQMYDPTADAAQQLAEAQAKAGREGKLVLVQVGGDWCKWCVRLNRFITEDAALLDYVESHYEWVHIYYGRENKNEATMERLGNPQEHGFPVFVLLDGEGRVVHTQSTGELEEGEGYSRAKVLQFLEAYAPSKEE